MAFKKLEDIFPEKGLKKKLNLDERDIKLMSMLQKDPDTTQDKLASSLKLSQPSVWARLKKLKESGAIDVIAGTNFKKVDLFLAKIDLSATDTDKIIQEFIHCPFFINAFVMSGKHNLCLLFTSTSLKHLEGIVNHHLRSNPLVKEIEMNIIISTTKDFIMPINIDCEDKDQQDCPQHCKQCEF